VADGMSAYLVREVEAAANIIVRLRTEVAAVHGTGRLEALTLRADTTGATETLPAGALFILIGAEPHTDWLAGTLERDDRGFVLTGRDLLRDGRPPRDWRLDRPPLLLEASCPACSRPATSVAARSSGSRRPSAKALPPSNSSTSTSASPRQLSVDIPTPWDVSPARRPLARFCDRRRRIHLTDPGTAAMRSTTMARRCPRWPQAGPSVPA